MASIEKLMALIAQFIDDPGTLSEDTPLLSTGRLDSFDLVGLVGEMEDLFGVDIPVDEIDVETFDTPRRMLSWVEGGTDGRT
jgi:acyl carrier protein